MAATPGACKYDAAMRGVLRKRIALDGRSVGYAVVLAAPEESPADERSVGCTVAPDVPPLSAADAPAPASEQPQPKRSRHALLVCTMLGGTSDGLAFFVPAFTDLVSQHPPSDSEEWLLLSVDRPGIGSTSPLKASAGCSPSTSRLEASVSDSLAVLSAERIDRVHVLGMCLGHPYAAAMVKRLLSEADGSGSYAADPARAPRLGLPYLLLAPWVSTECEHTMRAARLSQAWLSPSLLSAGLSVASGVNSMMTGAMLTSMPAGWLGQSFANATYEAAERERFTAEDLDFNEQVMRRMLSASKAASTPEMQVAVDPEWQHKVCDCITDMMAGDNGGPLLSSPDGLVPVECDASAAAADAPATPSAREQPPWCCIWLGTADRMVPNAATEWLAARYGSRVRLTRVEGASHAGLLGGGGPSRDAPIYKDLLRCVFTGGDKYAACRLSFVDMQPVAASA